MKNSLKTLVLVVVLLVAGYLLLPYVKPNPNLTGNKDDSNQSSSDSSGVKTFVSDDFGAKFDYNTDQDGNGTADTAVDTAGDKIFVYYTAAPKEQGQWVQKFTKDPNVSLADAVKSQFLQGIPESDCFATDMGKFYSDNGAMAPDLPPNTERVIIAYPFPEDETQPFFQNADKCPQGYSLTNGLSYFEMNSTHPDKYYFFSIGQYPIFADTNNQTVWQDTFQVTK